MPAQERSGDENLGASRQVAGEGGEGAAVGLLGEARSPGSLGPAGSPDPRPCPQAILSPEQECFWIFIWRRRK